MYGHLNVQIFKCMDMMVEMVELTDPAKLADWSCWTDWLILWNWLTDPAELTDWCFWTKWLILLNWQLILLNLQLILMNWLTDPTELTDFARLLHTYVQWHSWAKWRLTWLAHTFECPYIWMCSHLIVHSFNVHTFKYQDIQMTEWYYCSVHTFNCPHILMSTY